MLTRTLDRQLPFTTKDGSTIRELFGLAIGGSHVQSLAEARLEPGAATQRHRHALSEEVYFVLAGEGVIEIEGEEARLVVGDGVVIPAGAAHTIAAVGGSELRFLCMCAPPYTHEDTVLAPARDLSAER